MNQINKMWEESNWLKRETWATWQRQTPAKRFSTSATHSVLHNGTPEALMTTVCVCVCVKKEHYWPVHIQRGWERPWRPRSTGQWKEHLSVVCWSLSSLPVSWENTTQLSLNQGRRDLMMYIWLWSSYYIGSVRLIY